MEKGALRREKFLGKKPGVVKLLGAACIVFF